MEKTVFKYPLKELGKQAVLMPKYAEILCIKEQGGVVVLYATVDTGQPTEERIIWIHETGSRLQNDYLKYLGTVLLYQQTYVLHVFEEERQDK